MHDPLVAVPWNTETLWLEVNFSLAHAMRQHHWALNESCRQACRIKRQLESTFPLMDRICRQTCPTCTENCCARAWVWADFKDLLFLHLARIPALSQQLRCRQGDHCRYLSPEGCRLERLQRPFVCTWYICPAQKRLLKKQPPELERLLDNLEQIKRRRHLMEDAFIRAVANTKATPGDISFGAPSRSLRDHG